MTICLSMANWVAPSKGHQGLMVGRGLLLYYNACKARRNLQRSSELLQYIAQCTLPAAAVNSHQGAQCCSSKLHSLAESSELHVTGHRPGPGAKGTMPVPPRMSAALDTPPAASPAHQATGAKCSPGDFALSQAMGCNWHDKVLEWCLSPQPARPRQEWDFSRSFSVSALSLAEGGQAVV